MVRGRMLYDSRPLGVRQSVAAVQRWTVRTAVDQSVEPGYRFGVNPPTALELVACRLAYKAPRNEALYSGAHAGSAAMASSVAISAFVLGIFLLLEA